MAAPSAPSLIASDMRVETSMPDGRARLRARLEAFVAAEGRAEFVALDSAAAPATRPAASEPASPAPPAGAASARPFDRPLSARERHCLTEAVYYEARSESDDGQAAVAEVILNRASSGRYPADVCEVVYQRNARACQFTYTCDGSIGRTPVQRAAWARAERIATDVAEERRARILPPRSVNYHADYVAPGWGRRLERVQQIGAHVFYGAPLQGGVERVARSAAPERPAGLEFRPLEALQRAYAAATGSPEAS
jgi:hypothetical protein